MNSTISTSPNTPSAVEGDRPRVEEDDLDVEDDEEHRGQVVLDREAAAADRLRRRLDAALVGVELGPVVALRARQRAGDDGEDREAGREGGEHEDRNGDVHGQPSSAARGRPGWSPGAAAS